MRTIITGDGSPTLHNPVYDEAYHCTRGAVAEAVGKYVQPCGLADLARKTGGVSILDIGFGLGYNACAALDEITGAVPGAEIEVLGLEKDPETIAAIAGLEPPLDHYGLIKELAASPTEPLCRGNVKLRLVLGDAAETIGRISGPFDAAFHDPFSPRKNPDMWTAGFFTAVFGLLKPGGVLATYSCARQVRANLGQVGFRVCDGPVLNRRGPGTLAYK